MSGPPTIDALWERWRGPLLGWLRGKVGDPHEAEDLLQEVFLRAHRAHATLHAPERATAWLWQIARNVVTDAYRQRREQAPLPEDLAAPAGAEADTLTVRQLARCVRPLLGRLAPADRAALEQTAFEGMSQQALSAALGLSFSGLKARVQRARGRLQALLLACCAVARDQAGRLSAYRPLGGGCGAGGCAGGDESFGAGCRLSGQEPQ
ncbi:MAG TPA: sigma-70 family RNA polymerase sigma factor [Herpetosiphonaceae bacterium]